MKPETSDYVPKKVPDKGNEAGAIALHAHEELVVIAVFVIAVLATVSLWVGNRYIGAGPYHNVPGKTTGQGRNSLMNK
jgi:hypothetical protein